MGSLIAALIVAATAVTMPQGKQAYFDDSGNPLAGGKVYTYAAGTSTPLATYSDRAGAVPNTNPVILDARGEATIFWSAAGYKVVLKDSADVTLWTQDELYPPATLDGVPWDTINLGSAYVTATGTATTKTLADWTAFGPVAASSTLVTATGSTAPRNLQDRAADTVNPLDYGAKCDGVTDDAPALIATQTAAGTSKTIVFTCTLHLATAVGTVSAPVRFEGGGALDVTAGGSVSLSGSIQAPARQVFYARTGLLVPDPVAVTTGAGTLASGTYAYRVSALNAVGETTASWMVSNTIVGPAGNTVSWSAVAGATGYRVYGRTAALGDRLLATVGAVTTWTDDGSVATGALLPTHNSTTGIEIAYESSVPEVYPEWWGARRDGTELTPTTATNDAAAFQFAIHSGRPVKLSPGIYYVVGPLKLPARPQSVAFRGDNQRTEATGRRGRTHVHVGGTVFFACASTPAVNATGLPEINVQVAGLSFATSSNAVFFKDVKLVSSEIHSNLVFSFDAFVEGSVNVSWIHHNPWIGGLKRGMIVKSTAISPSPPALVDSVIDSNYIGGRLSETGVVLIDIGGGSTTSIVNNYLDFAYKGVVGVCSLCTIQGNTFDYLFRGVDLGFGGRETTIIGNRFFNIRKSVATTWTSPTAEMTNNDWVSIYLDRATRGITVTGNVVRKCDRFMVLEKNWYKRIKESGNLAVDNQGFSGPMVYTVGRTVDEAGWAAQPVDLSGDTGDGTELDFASRHARVDPTYASTIGIDCDLGDHFVVTVTDGFGFTVENPERGTHNQKLRITIRNTSGGALGTVTWGTAFKISAWTSPANGFSRTIDFTYDGTNWIESAQTAADVPN